MQHFKLPNGFGSIVKLSGARRKPYAVRKHGKYLQYCTSYEQALTWLVNYNNNPLIYNPSTITFAEVYALDMAERKRKIAEKTVKGYESAFKACATLHDKSLAKLKVADLQGAINSLSKKGIGQPTQKKVRQIMHNIYRYAVKYQLIDSTADISNYIDIDILKRKYVKKPFNMRQLNRVKAIADDSNNPLSAWASCVIMMCYSGPRPSEFLAIHKEDVKLKSRFYRIRDSKTAAGRNRIVPISKKALLYYEKWMKIPGTTLITLAGKQVKYQKFLKLFYAVMDASKCKHKPHECRHTCATWLDDKGANKLAIKKILGHATQDITDAVYTHKDLRQLKKAVDLL